MSLPFDRVVIEDNFGKRELSAQQFLELPLARRVRHILRREVTYWRGTAEVESGEALQHFPLSGSANTPSGSSRRRA